MPTALCGFNDAPNVKGADLLALIGPTILVNIGFDPSYRTHHKRPPRPAISGVSALVDSGAVQSCIDNILAASLNLPIIDRQPISGSNGSHVTNIYQAQVHIPSLQFTILGSFAGVDLVAGGQQHHALIGRTFLRNFKMIYEGTTGTVTITSD